MAIAHRGATCCCFRIEAFTFHGLLNDNTTQCSKLLVKIKREENYMYNKTPQMFYS